MEDLRREILQPIRRARNKDREQLVSPVILSDSLVLFPREWCPGSPESLQRYLYPQRRMKMRKRMPVTRAWHRNLNHSLGIRTFQNSSPLSSNGTLGTWELVRYSSLAARCCLPIRRLRFAWNRFQFLRVCVAIHP